MGCYSLVDGIKLLRAGLETGFMMLDVIEMPRPCWFWDWVEVVGFTEETEGDRTINGRNLVGGGLNKGSGSSSINSMNFFEVCSFLERWAAYAVRRSSNSARLGYKLFVSICYKK